MKKVELRNKALQCRNDEILMEKEDIITNIENRANRISDDVQQWISEQQSKSNDPPKSNPLDLEEELFEINRTATQFIETRVNMWNDANEELESVLVELDDKHQNINDLTKELDTVRGRLQHKQRGLERLEQNYRDDLVRDVNEYKIKYHDLRKQIESAEDATRKAEGDLAAATDSNHEMAEHLKQIERGHSELEVRDNHHQQVIGDITLKLQRKEEQAEQLQQHVLSLQMDLQNSILERKHLSRELAEKSDALIEYKTKLAQNQASSRKQTTDLESQLQSTLGELREKTNRCQRLKEKLQGVSDQRGVAARRR